MAGARRQREVAGAGSERQKHWRQTGTQTGSGAEDNAG